MVAGGIYHTTIGDISLSGTSAGVAFQLAVDPGPLSQIAGHVYQFEVVPPETPENTIQFGVQPVASMPSIKLTASNTIQFDVPDQINRNFNPTSSSTIQFDVPNQVNGNIDINADTTIQFDTVEFLPNVVEVVASTTIQFGPTSTGLGVAQVLAQAESAIILTPEVAEIAGSFNNGVINVGSAIHRIDNFGTQGGPIDPASTLILNGLSRKTQISFASSHSSDLSQVYLVEGTGPFGLIVRESIILDGYTPVTTINEFVRINSITKQSGASLLGNVTISNPTSTTIGVLYSILESGAKTETTTLQGMFNNVSSTPSTKLTYYEKFFIRNSTLEAINTLTVQEQSDPDNCVDFALDQDKNLSTTSVNRLTRPGAIPIESWNSFDKIFENFEPNDSIGVWLRLRIPPGSPNLTKSYVLKIISDGDEQLIEVIAAEASSEFAVDLLERRNSAPIGGGNPFRFIELQGAAFVEQLFYEPDPGTFRSQFYYNTRLNKLFKKINTIPRPVWKQVR